ncbi:hypothetical protein B9Z55_021089 [Caenorhabditis nigoni]|uniref:Lin-15A/B-like domain-containing protein n=2 Tax=Caenorhabditis nigoni TaxID=1611254 RepID=A0A2G5TQF4_9PELO|nr:hypothetical protein B9Z55_021089 [Caenorhabditis nigoni]
MMNLQMNEAVVKEEAIEETCNFTLKNGEFVEVKQEEIERKPENLLENEVKKEPIEFSENKNSDGFFEHIERKPKESHSEIEKPSEAITEKICQICQQRMPRNLLKLIKSEDEKTVLLEVFKVEGFDERHLTYVCYSHIQKIIDDNDGKVKKPCKPFEHLMRKFIRRNKYSMGNIRKQNCQVCRMSKQQSEFYDITSKNIRMVVIIGCILRGTHSVDQAMSYLTNTNGLTCYSHRKETIDKIFEHLGPRNIPEFFRCSRLVINDLVDIANNFDSNFTADHFFRAFYLLYVKKPKPVPTSL